MSRLADETGSVVVLVCGESRGPLQTLRCQDQGDRDDHRVDHTDDNRDQNDDDHLIMWIIMMINVVSSSEGEIY